MLDKSLRQGQEGDAVKPDTLRFTSCQAPVAEAFCAAVARYVGEHLGIAVEFIDGMPWPERLREFDAGRIHVCWMCGLPYVWRADRPDAPVELLAALVAAGAALRRPAGVLLRRRRAA